MRVAKWLLVLVAVLALGAIAAGCNGATKEEPKASTETGGDTKKDDGGAMDEAKDDAAPETKGGAMDEGKGGAEDGKMMAKPMVKFTDPAEGATVAGPDVIVTVAVEGFTLANKLSQPNVEGEGHIHWIVDGAKPQPSPEATYKAVGLATGVHSVTAELHQNMHEPLDPPATATVKFMVK